MTAHYPIILQILLLLILAATDLRAGDSEIPVLDLRACMEQLAAQNYELRARYLDVGAQASSAKRAARERWPQLSVTSTVQQHSEWQRIEQPSPEASAMSYSRTLGLAGLELALPLYTGGRLKASQRIEEHLVEAAMAGAADFRDRSLLELIEGYHQLQALDYLIQSIEASVEALESQLRQIEVMVRQQKAADVHRMRVQVRLSTLEQERIRIMDTQIQVRESLNFLMGLPAGSEWWITPLPEASGLQASADHSQPEALSVVRDDEVAARLRREATEAAVDVARSYWQPNLQLVGAWFGRSGFSEMKRYEDSFIGINLSWDLWDGGARCYRVAEALQSREAARLREAGVRARRRAEWERALSARRSASERLQISLSHRTVALETLRIEQRKYAEGQGTITEVLEAEAAALETKSLIATARADFFVSLAHYDFAAGSFFQAGARHPSLRAALRSDASTPFLIEQP